MTQIVVIGGKRYMKITPPWIKGYRPVTRYAEIL